MKKLFKRFWSDYSRPGAYARSQNKLNHWWVNRKK